MRFTQRVLPAETIPEPIVEPKCIGKQLWRKQLPPETFLQSDVVCELRPSMVCLILYHLPEPVFRLCHSLHIVGRILIEEGIPTHPPHRFRYTIDSADPSQNSRHASRKMIFRANSSIQPNPPFITDLRLREILKPDLLFVI